MMKGSLLETLLPDNLCRKEKRKQLKKLRRKQIGQQVAEEEKSKESAALDDEAEQLRIQLEEQSEAERLAKEKEEHDKQERLLANWCRKCIYLKPKLEKLAAEYLSNIKFYFVDVNAVPQAVVKRAEVTKMPTVQIWKDGKKLAQVIGGNKTWMVMDEVREMIKDKK